MTSKRSKAADGQDDTGREASDAELIERWKQGDELAASQLVQRHATALARFAASVGEHDEVDELVQDTFVRAFSSIDSFRGESSLRTWLFTIQRRLLLDRRRAQRRRRDVAEVDERTAASDYNPLDMVMANETAQRVRHAVGQLSPMQRDVFTLRVSEGLSYREIAEVLGSTEGAARVHYHNALRAVKEFIND